MGQADLVKQVQAMQAAKRQAAAGRLREILRRFSDPKPGDAQALQELLGVLAIGVDDLDALRTLLTELDRCKMLADRANDLEQALVIKHKAWVDGLAWAEKARRDLEAEIEHNIPPLLAARSNAEAAAKEAKAARGRLDQLEDQWQAFAEGRSVEDLVEARRSRMRAVAPEAITGGPAVPIDPSRTAERALLGDVAGETAASVAE